MYFNKSAKRCQVLGRDFVKSYHRRKTAGSKNARLSYSIGRIKKDLSRCTLFSATSVSDCK